MVQRISNAAGVTARGSFKGQRLTDAVQVKTDAADLMTTVFLNRRRDARADWLESGTVNGSRSITPRRYFATAASRENQILNAIEEAVYKSLEAVG